MLTPAFELVQDADFLTILIKARYAKVTEVEIFVDGKDFKFYSKPYFLRLHLPGRVVEDGRETAKYDVDSGSFEFRLPKEVPGEIFEGLDMLTTLLAPRGQSSAEPPGIEVTGGNETTDENQEDIPEQAEEIDWQVEQQPFQQEEDSLWGDTTYGFANKRSGVFQRLQDELCGIVDVSSPDTTQLTDRKRARQDAENDKFDDQHYLADLHEDDCIMDELLSHNPPWHQEWKDLQTKSKHADHNQDQILHADETIVLFSEDEKDQMRRLPKRDHLLDAATEKGALLSLVDIIFAYAYNVRTTLSENSVESAWTICKLSPTLSWLDWFTSLDDAVIACYRRSLCYPLYRHWKLANKVYQDVRKIFMLGRRRLLKCLLEIHRILASDEPHYILNELYITDYCVWIQTLSHKKIASLAKTLKKVKVTKSQVGFELEELEAAAELARQESSEGSEKDSVEAVHQHGYPHILQERSSRVYMVDSSNGGSRRDSAHQNGYPHILQEGSDRDHTAESSECGSRRDSPHQHGYPHVLQVGSDREHNTAESSDGGSRWDSADQHGYLCVLQEGSDREHTAESSDGGSRRDSPHGYPRNLRESSHREETTLSETGTNENNQDDIHVVDTDKVASSTGSETVEASCANEVTTLMSNLMLRKTENLSVLQSQETTQLSLEEWIQRPPCQKIEVYGDDADISSDHTLGLSRPCVEIDGKEVEETGVLEHLMEAAVRVENKTS